MRLPLIFGCAVLSGLLLSAQVSAQDSVPLFGDKTPDICESGPLGIPS